MDSFFSQWSRLTHGSCNAGLVSKTQESECFAHTLKGHRKE
jgi:hypothetical protein